MLWGKRKKMKRVALELIDIRTTGATWVDYEPKMDYIKDNIPYSIRNRVHRANSLDQDGVAVLNKCVDIIAVKGYLKEDDFV